MQVMWFSNEFRYGGGRFSYKTSCQLPINQETLEFENINYLEYKEFRKISILH
jgi:hypothetical protein